MVGLGTVLRALMIVGSSLLILSVTPPNLPLLPAVSVSAVAIVPSIWLSISRLRGHDVQPRRHRHVNVTPGELKKLLALIDSSGSTGAHSSA
jgi:hypothetical protein